MQARVSRWWLRHWARGSPLMPGAHHKPRFSRGWLRARALLGAAPMGAGALKNKKLDAACGGIERFAFEGQVD
ncbi:MAG TPA: hypothetical protein VMF89_23180 [Polyangiales bacterium]|nr:hypothetical protein [Polyangiales bacterium]